MIQNGLLAEVRQVQAAQHGQRRPAVPRPRRGTRPTTTASARTGARPAGSTTRPRSRREIKTWQRLHRRRAWARAAATVRCSTRRRTSAGMYFWANGIDWNTEKTEDLDACEEFLVDEFAPHIKAFDSYPSTKIAEGAYALSMAWNGDARAGVRPHRRRRRQPRRLGVGARRADDRAVDGQLLHRRRRTEPRSRARLDQLDADPRGLDQGPRLPRLQQRHEEHRASCSPNSCPT